jgi:hypothetical protein
MSIEYAVIGGIAGALSAVISYPLLRVITKNDTVIKIASAFIFIVIFNLSKTYIVPQYDAFTFESKIKNEYPIFKLISVVDPDDFKNYISEMKKSIIEGDNTNRDILLSSQLVSSVFLKYAPISTNQSIYNYITAQLELDNEIIDKNPDMILAMEFPGIFNITNSSSQLDIKKSEAFQKILKAKENVILSALQTPQKPLTEEEIKNSSEVLYQILKDLSDKYGAQNVVNTFQNPNIQSLDKTTAAKIIVSFYEEIISQGVDGSGKVFKLLMLLAKSEKQ